MKLKYKKIPQEICNLCFGYVKSNYQQSVPVSLIYIMIKYFLFQQEISIDKLFFSTRNIPIPGSFYFTSIWMGFIIDGPSISSQIILSPSFKINIFLSSVRYQLNGSEKCNKIKSVCGKLWKFSSSYSKYIYYIELIRNTSCDCPDTCGIIKIYIAPYYNQHINNHNQAYWKQILKLTHDTAINPLIAHIEIKLNESIDWRQEFKFKIISNNSNSIQIWNDTSDALFVCSRKSEKRVCCKTAYEQFLVKHE